MAFSGIFAAFHHLLIIQSKAIIIDIIQPYQYCPTILGEYGATVGTLLTRQLKQTKQDRKADGQFCCLVVASTEAERSIVPLL